MATGVNGFGKPLIDVDEWREQGVTFKGRAEQPPGGGAIVEARWDFEGRGVWEHSHAVDGDRSTMEVSVTCAYAMPGTYFPAFRVGAQRLGVGGRGPVVEILARMRVVAIARPVP
jgi:hypothetical protein